MKFNLQTCAINWDDLENNLKLLFRQHRLAVFNLITAEKDWYSISIIGIDRKGYKKIRIMCGNEKNIHRKNTLTIAPGTLQSMLKLRMNCDNYKYIGIHPLNKKC